MANLKELYLDNNKISHLDWKYFENNKKLEMLNLRNNTLSQIGSNFEPANLKIVDLSENICIDAKYPETSMDNIFEILETNCTIGIVLQCEYHHALDYTCKVINLKIENQNTKVIGVIGEHILQKSIDDVTKISFINQNIKFLPYELEIFFKNASKIEVISSNLTKMQKLKNFKEVKINFNPIDTIDDDTFNDSLGIQCLDFSNNNIKEIHVNKLASLTYLNLNNNLIENLPQNFLPNDNSIKEFHISRNKLMKIDSNIIKLLKNANIIELSENPCVDNKFNRSLDNEKKIMEIYGEVEFKC